MISEEALGRGGVEGSSLNSLAISEIIRLREGLTGSSSNPLLMSGALLLSMLPSLLSLLQGRSSLVLSYYSGK